MMQTVVKVFFTAGPDKIFDDKMYRPSDSQDFIQGLVHHLID